MKISMRLFKRNGWYCVEFHRGKVKALGTTDEAYAKEIYKEMKAEYLRGKLFNLDTFKKITLSKFRETYIESRAGISKATIKLDGYSLKLLADVVGSTLQMRAVTQEKIDEFKKASLLRGVKPKSVNTYLRHIKASLTYALDTGVIEKRPKIKMVPVGKSLPRVLGPDEAKVILAKAKETDSDLFRYLTFCLWTGARRSEAKNLAWQDVNFDERAPKKKRKPVCKLTGKGNRERMVPLLPAVVDVLKPVKRDIGPVFAHEHADTYSHRTHDLLQACGIVGHRLHDFRHTCATYLLKSGVDIRTVQKILGHVQISTTTIYTEVLDEMLQNGMAKLRFE